MKLFHCIVVMGAAMGTGCGGSGRVSGSAAADASGSGSATDSASSEGRGDTPDAACTTMLAFPGCSYAGPCRGTASNAWGPSDCAHPQQLTCGADSCWCSASAPLSPTDCPQTAQFHCEDWTQPCGCSCAPGAPGDAAACCPPGTSLDAGASCLAEFTCHSYDPPVGCECQIQVAIL